MIITIHWAPPRLLCARDPLSLLHPHPPVASERARQSGGPWSSSSALVQPPPLDASARSEERGRDHRGSRAQWLPASQQEAGACKMHQEARPHPTRRTRRMRAYFEVQHYYITSTYLYAAGGHGRAGGGDASCSASARQHFHGWRMKSIMIKCEEEHKF